MTYTRSVLITGISRESRQGYGGSWFAGLSDRLLVEVAREFQRLKATHEAGDDLATVQLVLHAILRAAERSDGEHGPPRLFVTHDDRDQLGTS
jgi:hypothetical protein